MPHFRKKPVVIEAVQFLEMGVSESPVWFVEALILPIGSMGRVWRNYNQLYIATLEGDLTASLGDWIIRGVKGELYPCKPDIFAATYEPADPPAPPALFRCSSCKRPFLWERYGDKWNHRQACQCEGMSLERMPDEIVNENADRPSRETTTRPPQAPTR